MVGLGAADRLGDDLVDHAQAQQIGSGDPQCLGCVRLALLVAPQDRGAALGRDHRVHRVLEHHHAIGHADRERSAAPPLAGDDGDDGNRQRRHLDQVGGDALGLAALLGALAGVGARRVDQRHHRLAESRRQAHDAQRLAMTFGVGLAEVATDALVGAAALLVADDGDAAAAEGGEAGDDRGVVAVGAVAVELDPVRHHAAHVVERVGAIEMARHLRALPGVEIAEDLGRRLAQLLAQPFELAPRGAASGNPSSSSMRRRSASIGSSKAAF